MISIIVPAYNAVRTLPACLNALLRQTQPSNEIILVNDGSMDQTMEVAQTYGVKVLEQTHQGPAAARNLGLKHAQGDIILFTDADCEPTPSWIAEMVHPFMDPQVVGVKGSYLSSQQETISRLVQYEFEERYDLLEKHATIDFIDTYAAAFRATVLREKGAFDPGFPGAVSEDAELSYRLARSGCRLIFNRQAAVYHQHPKTWDAYFCRKIRFSYWRMVAYRLHPGKAMRDTYTPQILKLQVVLMGLFLSLIGVSFFIPSLTWAGLATLIGFLSSTIPFTRRVWQRDHRLLIATQVFVIVRTLAIAIGVMGGIVGMFFFRPMLPRKEAEQRA